MAGTSQWWLAELASSNTGAVRFCQLSDSALRNNNVGTTPENQTQVPCAAAGSLLTFRVALGTAPGASKSWRLQVSVNGSASTTLDVTITGTATTGTATGTVAVSAGDLLAIKITPSGTPAATKFYFSTEFLPTTANYYVYGSVWFWNAVNAANVFHGVFHGSAEGVATGETILRRSVAPCAGTIRAICVWTVTASGVGTSWDVGIYQNGADVGSTLNIANTTTPQLLTGLAISVAAGDTLSIHVVNKNGAAASSLMAYSVIFEPTTAGEFIWGMSSPAAITTNQFMRYTGCSALDTVDTTEANVQHLCPATGLSILGVAVNISQGAAGGTSRTFTSRINTGSGTVAVVLGAAVTKNSSRSVAIHDDLTVDQLIDIGITSSGSTGTSLGGSTWSVSVIPTVLLAKAKSYVPAVIG